MDKIGYYNATASPLTISVGGVGHEINAGQPICHDDGKLVRHDVFLDSLVQSKLLSVIPANHPDFKDWDNRIAQRSKITFTKALPKDGPKPEVLVTVVSSDQGLQEESLPPGVKMITEKGKRLFEYKGKKFAGIKALKAYLEQIGEA